MKRIISFATAAICTLLLTVNVFAEPILLSYDGKVVEYKGDILSLRINGEAVNSNVKPVVLNDRTLVPARAVFEKMGANVDWIGDQQKVLVSLNNFKVELKLDDKTALVNGNQVSMDVPAKLINDSTMIPARFVAEQLNMKVGWREQEKIVSIDNSTLKGITVDPTVGGNVVNINLDYFQNYKVFTLKNPDRIVIDFPNVNGPASLKKIDVNSGALNDVRYANFQDSTGYSAARVVLDVAPDATYKADKVDSKLVVSLTGNGAGVTPTPAPTPIPTPTPTTTPSSGNTPVTTPKPSQTPTPTTGPLTFSLSKPVTSLNGITYNISGDRVYFKMTGDLAYMPSQDVKKYYDWYTNDGKQYVMRYKKELADLGEGVMNINDSYFDTVQFVKDDGTGYSEIIFNCKTKLTFQTFQRFDYGSNNYIDTVIDVFAPATDAQKLVVIDPGHGGFELGAVSDGLIEKHLNLDISLRVNNLLKAKGVKTYIIRGDDSYVDLYERAILANKLNAKLFLCVHNNSFNGSAYGTESLYYTGQQTGFTGKTFAQTIQNKLVNALGVYNRGIVERPNLVVLNRTLMPASLVEVGFIDNAAEKANLLNADYRQKAAQAICDAIIESLQNVK